LRLKLRSQRLNPWIGLREVLAALWTRKLPQESTRFGGRHLADSLTLASKVEQHCL
jgi:hypothetical protein